MNARLDLIVLPALVVGALIAVSVRAADALPWYLWESVQDGKTECAQFPPGKDWVRTGGAYGNSGCSPARNQSMDQQQKTLKAMGINFSSRSGK